MIGASVVASFSIGMATDASKTPSTCCSNHSPIRSVLSGSEILFASNAIQPSLVSQPFTSKPAAIDFFSTCFQQAFFRIQLLTHQFQTCLTCLQVGLLNGYLGLQFRNFLRIFGRVDLALQIG